MACATLKRSLDWEPVLGGRPAKRRRCIPFCASPQQRPSPGCSTSNNSPISKSAFPEIISKKLTPEYMAANIRAEIRRMHRRKQLAGPSSEVVSDGSSSGGEQGPESPPRFEKPLFTYKQVGLICERMVREREDELRAEYDQVLINKLAEQYDAFVKFTDDQIQKRYEAAPSYLS